MAKPPDSELHHLTPKQVADRLLVSPITVRGWALQGLLKADVTPGGHRRFSLTEVERFARERDFENGRAATRVLIVDHTESVARYLRDFLTFHGIEADFACDGFEAGCKLQSFQPDVLLLDFMMPHLNGFDVCRRVRQSPGTRHVRVIAMTALQSPSNQERILGAGAAACLLKPIDDKRLIDELNIETRLPTP